MRVNCGRQLLADRYKAFECDTGGSGEGHVGVFEGEGRTGHISLNHRERRKQAEVVEQTRKGVNSSETDTLEKGD